MTTHRLLRDLAVTVIPAGEPAVLASGTEVHIVQTLGGNVTVRTDGGLFRVAAEDASAIDGYRPGEESDDRPTEFSESAVWDALRSCYDPEIPLNIVDLGLVYDVRVADGVAAVRMTMTTPGCPLGGYLDDAVRDCLWGAPGVEDVDVRIVWDPPWRPEMMSDAAREQLGWAR